MQTLVVMVIALDQAEAHSKAVAQARSAFGDRFVAAKVNRKPAYRPKRATDRHVFRVSLSLTAGSIEEWHNGSLDFSELNLLLRRLERPLG